MKKELLVLGFLFMFQYSPSQEKLGRPFFTGAVNFTLGINKITHFLTMMVNLFGSFSTVFRIGFGYEFKRKVAIGFNTGLDYHWNYAVSVFPTYRNLKYNITEDDNDSFFIEMRYEKMWTPSINYPDGKYYGLGLGIQVAGEKRWNTIIRLDFHRKGILGFKNNRLDSVYFGIGFTFFKTLQ